MQLLRDRSIQFLLLAVFGLLIPAFFYSRSRDAQHQEPRVGSTSGAERQRLEAAVGAVPQGVEAPRVQLWNRAEQAVPLEQYRGRMVFVNFWATWCGPCVEEMPSLIRLHDALDPADIAFVSIAEDDFWPPVDAYLKRSPLPFDVYRDRPPRVEILFETGSYPTSFLIDRDGTLLYRFNGARHWDAPEVRALLALDGVRSRSR